MINHPAVRAFLNAVKRSTRYAAQIEGAQADRQIDGGEWSDCFHDEAIGRLEEQIATRIASRFGMTGTQLQEQVIAASCEQDVRLMARH